MALVKSAEAGDFAARVAEAYRAKRPDLSPALFVGRPEAGARLLLAAATGA